MTTRNSQPDDAGRVLIDGSYLRDQARDAVSVFFAPLSGVYNAALGIKRDAPPSKENSKKDKPISAPSHKRSF